MSAHEPEQLIRGSLMDQLLTGDELALGQVLASRRPRMMDALLHGHIVDQWSMWEVANDLRLPSQGPFVVVAAAKVPRVGEAALPEIESKLRGLDVYSAWRVLPDLQIGIVHVKSDQHLDKILALLSRSTTDRVGVSARFDDLRETPQALHVAKIALRGRAHNASPVAVFDGSILATAAVSAPDVMVKSVATVLDGFGDLGEEERELTLRDVPGVAGQRCVGARDRRKTHLSPQYRPLPASANRAAHGPLAVASQGI